MTPRIQSFLHLFGRSLIVLCPALVVLGLCFRGTLYWRLPVTPGDPYGIADILELGLGFLLIGLSFTSALLGTLLLIFRHWGLSRLGLFLVLVGVVSPTAYFLLHPSVAKISSRAGLTPRSSGPDCVGPLNFFR